MVSVLDSGASGQSSSPGWEHFVVFLGETPRDTDKASFTSEFNAGGNPAMD